MLQSIFVDLCRSYDWIHTFYQHYYIRCDNYAGLFYCYFTCSSVVTFKYLVYRLPYRLKKTG